MNPSSAPTSDAYIPGVCNINTAEIDQRRKAGYLGVAIFVVLLLIALFTPLDRWFRLILIAPAFLAAIGFLQAKNHFCVGYAGAGLQNASEGSNKAETIALQAAVAKDKQRARRMNLQALAISVVISLIAVALPNL